MIPIPWSHRGSKPLTLTWKKTSLGSFFLLHAERDFSHAWFYINKQIPHEDRFLSTSSQTDKDLLVFLRPSRVWRNVSFPCYHRHLKCWLILTFPVLFLWHSTVAVSGHNVLGALAKVLQLTVHRFSDIPWHELGTFCLVICNCRYWFGGSGLLSISTLYASYLTIMNLPNFHRRDMGSPPSYRDVKAAHSASTWHYLSLKWQQWQALKGLYIMAMIIYLERQRQGEEGM